MGDTSEWVLEVQFSEPIPQSQIEIGQPC